MDQIKSTRNKADEVTEDLKNKATIHAQLMDEFEKVNKNISRYISCTSLTEYCSLIIYVSSVEMRTHQEF